MTDLLLPKTKTRTVGAPPSGTIPLDGTRLFVSAEAWRGPLEPVRIRSPRDLARKLERTGIGIGSYDAIDVALRIGVPEVYFSRITGEDAVAASANIDGPTAGSPYVFTITANEVGEFGNGATGGYTYAVQNGPGGAGERQIVLKRAGVVVSTSPVFTARADALAWNSLQTSVTLELGLENALPAVIGDTNLAGGTADLGAVVTADVRTALDRFPADLGNGQAVTPGRSTAETSGELLGHCAERGRTALVELADGLDPADLVDVVATLRALGTGAEGVARLGGAWAQHATGPGIVSGATRTVPYTMVVAGLIALLEGQEGHPNVSPFGDYGVSPWVDSVTRYFDTADVDTLIEGGVNVVENFRGVPRNATFHTLEPIDGSSDWVDLAHTRVDRFIHATANDEGRKMGARVINRNTVQEFGSKFRTRLQRELFDAGALFGDTPSEAMRVDVDSVNDDDTMAAKEVNAAVGVVMSEHAEFVNIDVSKIPIGQEV